ncbi:MAG TPA: winged helix-turn-helix domain-containing protein [Acidimicrobiales bacterium]|nr:winged helix-turn-helix domain-containing protein [Acidimicrobiales bacterium]
MSRRAAPPEIDDFGLLRYQGSWIALSTRSETIMRALIAAPGRAVTRHELATATWPDGGRSPHALDVHIHQLRPRLAGVGLAIRTLRGRGFVLEALTGEPATRRR